MLLSPAKETASSIMDSNDSPDHSLQAIVDACVSNVAVLDESGSIIYASKAWSLLDRNSQEKNGAASSYIESCRRFTQSELDEETNITLADDIQQILLGNEKEFHRQYCSLVYRLAALCHTRRAPEFAGFDFQSFDNS